MALFVRYDTVASFLVAQRGCCGHVMTAELLYQLSYRSTERSGQDSNLRPVD